MTAALLLLGVAGLVLCVAAVVTAAPPARPVPGLVGYFDLWAALHGGYDLRAGSRVARGWLTGVFRLCRPLARRGVAPDVLTLAGVEVTGAAAVAAAAGARWPVLAALLVTAAALLDNADGCVALLTDRASAWGYVLDSVADRVSDVLLLLALWAVGAPAAAAVAAGVALGLLEYLRARAGAAGMDEVGAVTPGDRPGRIIVAIFALLAAGLVPRHAAGLATAGAVSTAVLAAAGLVRLLVVVRRRLATRSVPLG